MPSITFEIPDSYAVTLGKRDGNPTSVAIPVTEFPANVLAAIFAYGVQRKFNDSVGGSDKTIDDKVKGVNDLIEQFKAGEVRAARTGGESVDPFTAAVRAVMRPLYKAAWTKAHGSDGWKALEEADIVAAIDKLYAAQSPEGKAKIDAAANGRIEADRIAREAKKGLTLDLGDMSGETPAE